MMMKNNSDDDDVVSVDNYHYMARATYDCIATDQPGIISMGNA